MATVTSPAMLEYLDNAQSATGKINENYARELMELHTLGVSGGPSGSTYTQQDVQELARILTGAGVNFTGEPRRLNPKLQPLYVKRGAFEFNPARHDTGAKTVLGHTFQPGGLDEIQGGRRDAVPSARNRALRQSKDRHLLSFRRAAASDCRSHGPHVSADRRLDRGGVEDDVPGS